jgi:predicted GH43/DUF377 family glycosyl hydrolase
MKTLKLINDSLISTLFLFVIAFGNKGSAQENTVEISPIQFFYTEVSGIGHEKGCTRRDPSDVILVDDTHYVYYTKVYGKAPGYWGTVWCASSKDGGYTWKEEGEVLGKGNPGHFDSQATFTPNIMEANNKYYLFYTGVSPTTGRSDGVFENNSTTDITAIGLAVADSPTGPFLRIENNPVLEVSNKAEDFDSYRVDDAALLFRDGKFWLYYKGRSREHGREGPSKTQMGVAFSNQIKGPYEKYGNPILPDSHEVLIWPFHGGIMALASKSSTLEFAPDGIDFLTNRQGIPVVNRPSAPGAFRPELTGLPTGQNGIEWGISMIHNGDEAYLIRFQTSSYE